MIRQIAPVFFTTNIPRTLGYYEDVLGFSCSGTWDDPPVYAIVARDQHAIHFRDSRASASDRILPIIELSGGLTVTMPLGCASGPLGL
jgi:hypothetical protein